jgi:photosynthetic reaction center H subunit
MSNVIIVGGLDVAELTFYVFFGFFLVLVWYLNRESRREGYPLENDLTGKIDSDIGRLDFSAPKVFQLPHGLGTYTPEAVPRDAMPENIRPRSHSGAALDVVGDLLSSGLGPAAYALRADRPDLDMFGNPRIVPVHVAEHITVEARDADPRGLPVTGLDDVIAGTVADLWVDRSEHVIRYLEVALTEGGSVLLPMTMAQVVRNRVHCDAVTGAQFAGAPRLASPVQITLLEEDKITAYFGAGYLWATPGRSEPLL